MTRARFVLGFDADPSQPSLRERFDAVRQSVVSAERDSAALAQEIVAMRDKVRRAHPVPPGMVDVKHSPGAMVDVEFVVQYLVLSQAARHPVLRANTGNIQLLQAAEQVGLLPVGMGQAAASAYRLLRQIQHRARLDEAPTQVPAEAVADATAAVGALWRHVLRQEPV